VDQGATWSAQRLAEGGASRFFPYLVARGPGELAASWFTLDQERLRAHVGSIRVDETGGARLVEAEPFEPDSWGRSPQGTPPPPDPAGEYLALVFLQDGDLAVANPIQNARAQRMGFALRRARAR